MNSSRLLVFTLVFSLGLLMPATADAFFRSDRSDQLNGTYIRSDQQGQDIPTSFFVFSKEEFVSSEDRAGTSKGKYSITGDTIELVHSDGRIAAYKITRTPNTIIIDTGRGAVTYVLATQERLAQIEENKARRAEEMRRATLARMHKATQPLPSGFTALSEDLSGLNRTYPDAFCQLHGGRLLRINNSDSWDGKNPPRENISIDGFGREGAPWPDGLPDDASYGTGTAYTDGDRRISWIVTANGGLVYVTDSIRQGLERRVVCVP